MQSPELAVLPPSKVTAYASTVSVFNTPKLCCADALRFLRPLPSSFVVPAGQCLAYGCPCEPPLVLLSGAWVAPYNASYGAGPQAISCPLSYAPVPSTAPVCLNTGSWSGPVQTCHRLGACSFTVMCSLIRNEGFLLCVPVHSAFCSRWPVMSFLIW